MCGSGVSIYGPAHEILLLNITLRTDKAQISLHILTSCHCSHTQSLEVDEGLEQTLDLNSN